jgi:hypothetical protein
MDRGMCMAPGSSFDLRLHEDAADECDDAIESEGADQHRGKIERVEFP